MWNQSQLDSGPAIFVITLFILTKLLTSSVPSAAIVHGCNPSGSAPGANDITPDYAERGSELVL